MLPETAWTPIFQSRDFFLQVKVIPRTVHLLVKSVFSYCWPICQFVPRQGIAQCFWRLGMWDWEQPSNHGAFMEPVCTSKQFIFRAITQNEGLKVIAWFEECILEHVVLNTHSYLNNCWLLSLYIPQFDRSYLMNDSRTPTDLTYSLQQKMCLIRELLPNQGFIQWNMK